MPLDQAKSSNGQGATGSSDGAPVAFNWFTHKIGSIWCHSKGTPSIESNWKELFGTGGCTTITVGVRGEGSNKTDMDLSGIEGLGSDMEAVVEQRCTEDDTGSKDGRRWGWHEIIRNRMSGTPGFFGGPI
jgi:hypothetical protein